MDTNKTPHYVVLVEENLRYKLDETKRVIGNASDELIAFAKQYGTLLPNHVTAWDQFARDFGLSANGRKQMVCYLLTEEAQRKLAEQ